MTKPVFNVDHIPMKDCVTGQELKTHTLYVLVCSLHEVQIYGYPSYSLREWSGEIVHRCGLDLASLTGRLFRGFYDSQRNLGPEPDGVLFYELPTEPWHKLFESLLAPPVPYTVSKEYLRSLEFD